MLQLYNLLVGIKSFTIAFSNGNDSYEYDVDFVTKLTQLIDSRKLSNEFDEDSNSNSNDSGNGDCHSEIMAEIKSLGKIPHETDGGKIAAEVRTLAKEFLQAHPLVIDGTPLLSFDKFVWLSETDNYHRAVVKLDNERYNFLLKRSQSLLPFSKIDAQLEQQILEFLLDRNNWKNDHILFEWTKYPRLGGYCMLKLKQMIDASCGHYSSHSSYSCDGDLRSSPELQLHLVAKLRYKGKFVDLLKIVHWWFHWTLFLGDMDTDDLVSLLHSSSCSPQMPSAVSLIVSSYQEQLSYLDILEKLLDEPSTLLSSEYKMLQFWFNRNPRPAFSLGCAASAAKQF